MIHDDGYTIQCDTCWSWQHTSSMGLSRGLTQSHTSMMNITNITAPGVDQDGLMQRLREPNNFWPLLMRLKWLTDPPSPTEDERSPERGEKARNVARLYRSGEDQSHEVRPKKVLFILYNHFHFNDILYNLGHTSPFQNTFFGIHYLKIVKIFFFKEEQNYKKHPLSRRKFHLAQKSYINRLQVAPYNPMIRFRVCQLVFCTCTYWLKLQT